MIERVNFSKKFWVEKLFAEISTSIISNMKMEKWAVLDTSEILQPTVAIIDSDFEIHICFKIFQGQKISRESLGFSA